MNKTILISIKPKWVAKILNGEKTIEIRKTMPKCDLPVDVYIYCTKEEDIVYFGYGCGNTECLDTKKQIDLMREWKLGNWNDITWWLDKKHNDRVVAKFTLNKVEEIKFDDKEVQRKACLTEDELFDYLFVNEPYHEDMKKGYAWHISNLIIFDKPRELSEFRKMYRSKGYPQNQSWYLTEAPQSWCYIEGEED